MSGRIRILGVDPGSVTTGWGVIDSDGRHNIHVAHGCIAAGSGDMPARLDTIYRELRAVIEAHGPVEMGIEDVFVARNAMAALKLGQARGAALCAGVGCGLVVAEYPARLVKQGVVGIGGASKQQVQHMVGVLLNMTGDSPAADAADALAVALCHAHARTRPAGTSAARRRPGRRAVRWT